MSHPKSREGLVGALERGAKLDYVFFWRPNEREGELTKACFSNWYPTPIELDGRTWATTEHYMMFAKARIFGDEASMERIAASTSPAEAQKLGRKVSPYADEPWAAQRYFHVFRCVRAKFEQHPELGRFLRETGDRVLVEASPRDRIWGIGMAEDDAEARHPSRWKGLNLLGFVLMDVRDELA
ncbi:MAG: NADAR family protein [Polyangiales bacterium]